MNQIPQIPTLFMEQNASSSNLPTSMELDKDTGLHIHPASTTKLGNDVNLLTPLLSNRLVLSR